GRGRYRCGTARIRGPYGHAAHPRLDDRAQRAGGYRAARARPPGASGKVAAGNDIVKRIIQGADFTNSARAMMMAIGCIQAQRCHTDRCPTGVTTQDPRRQWGLVVEDKSVRVRQYQEGTVAEAVK